MNHSYVAPRLRCIAPSTPTWIPIKGDAMGTRIHDEVRFVVGQTACEFVLVPASAFLMGTDAERAPIVTSKFPAVQTEWVLKEAPAHEVYLADYYIARTPITNQLWVEYVHLTGSPRPSSWAASPPEAKHPVSGITYEEAESFCHWVSQVSGHRLGLPTEAQWEKAARGTDGREWPWGKEFSAEKCNTREGGYRGVTAVDRFPAGSSPYGALNMGGNVEEWTSDLYRPYPGGDAVTDDFGGPGQYRVTRGGHWEGGGDLARCARRHGAWAHSRVGARLVLSVPASGSAQG